jgi:hypothetical protein
LIFVSSRLGRCVSGEYLVSWSKLQNDRTGRRQRWVLVASCRPQRLSYKQIKLGVWSRVMVKPQVVIGQAGFKMKAYGHIISEELSDQFIRKELAAIVDIRARFCLQK